MKNVAKFETACDSVFSIFQLLGIRMLPFPVSWQHCVPFGPTFWRCSFNILKKSNILTADISAAEAAAAADRDDKVHCGVSTQRGIQYTAVDR